MNTNHGENITDRKTEQLPPLPSEFQRGICREPHVFDLERVAYHRRAGRPMCETCAYDYDRFLPVREALAQAIGVEIYDQLRDERLMRDGAEAA